MENLLILGLQSEEKGILSGSTALHGENSSLGFIEAVHQW